MQRQIVFYSSLTSDIDTRTLHKHFSTVINQTPALHYFSALTCTDHVAGQCS